MNHPGKRPRNPPASGARPVNLPQRGRMKVVVHNGKQLYQWDQTTNQVFIEIIAPPPDASVFCNINENYVQLGAQRPGLPTAWYLNHDTGGAVNKDESYWRKSKETCKIVLTKANPGVVWRFALKDDRDESRQQKSNLPTSRPPQPMDRVRSPVLRQQQQQRALPTKSRPPFRGRGVERATKQDPPTTSKSTSPMRSPSLAAPKPQQMQQQQTTARSPSSGRRRARPVVTSATPVRAKSTSSLFSPLQSAGQLPQQRQQPKPSRSPSPGRRKSRLAKEARPSPVKAKSTSALPPSPAAIDQPQQQAMTARSTSPGRRKGRPTHAYPPPSHSTTAQRPQDQRPKKSKSMSPGRRRRSGKENVPSSEKETPRASFLDRFKASKEGQLQQGRQPAAKRKSDFPPSLLDALELELAGIADKDEEHPPSPTQRKPSSSKEESSFPAKAKRAVSFLTPPRESEKKQQPETSRSSAAEEINAKPTNADPSSQTKGRSSSSFRSPLSVIRQRQQKRPDEPTPSQRKEDKSKRNLTRPKSPSPERRKDRVTKTDPTSKVRSSLRTPPSSNYPKGDHKSKSNPKGRNSNQQTVAIVGQPTEINSIGRGNPRPSLAQGPYMQKLLEAKELELKSQEDLVQKLNRKINQLEDIIATRRHQDKSRTKRNENIALTVDDLEDQLNQSEAEHQRELERLEKLNRRVTAELQEQTALVKSMNRELGKTEYKMVKQRRLAELQAREIRDRESLIESLQDQLKEDGEMEHSDHRVMAELQKQVNRVKTMKQGMKEYKRLWNEQRQFADMQSQQIMEKQEVLNILSAKLERANRRTLEMEYERKLDHLDNIDRNRALAESQARLEELQREHKQALEKTWSLESELKEQVQNWNEMEKVMAETHAEMAWMSENLDPDNRYEEHLVKKAIRELIEKRPDGQARERIKQLDSEIEEQERDWIQLEKELDFAQGKVASMGRQLSSKKLSDYILPDTPRASVNEHLDRMSMKMMSARNQLEEAKRRRIAHSQRREPHLLENDPPGRGDRGY
ncbi:unnamed protein product [Cylindrotheca closterium]|uniref:CS domain-containing protein n=1 Tax=Cylindrotheca closterium TaxID=2856 RepID=A0AAD2JIL0_9STRA|nr:unnamed protein product [Cylindrotheca closterium]